MRIEGGVKPLLARRRGIRSAQDFRDFGKRLVVVDDLAAAAEVNADYMTKQLDQGLSVAQDS